MNLIFPQRSDFSTFKNWQNFLKFLIFVDGKKYLVMKQLCVYLILCISFTFVRGQVTLSSGNVVNGTLDNNEGAQFWVQNTNAYPVRLFRINMQNDLTQKPAAHTFSVWFKPNAANAAPGPITVANGWTNAGTFAHNQKFNTLYPIISNLAIDIPAGATYRIWINTTNFLGCSVVAPGGGVLTNSAAGVTVKTGDSISWWGTLLNNVAPRDQLDPLAQFAGEIEFYPLAACAGTPEVGSIVGDMGSCANEVKFYYLNGYIPGNGITYQWQISTTSPTTGFTNTGTNTTMLARTRGATNEFIRCIATCGGLRDTTPVFVDTVKAFYHCYCQPNVAAAGLPNFGSVESASFSTTSTNNAVNPCEDYTDYKNLPVAKVRAGDPLVLSLKNKICDPTNANMSASMWVDLNKNGAFDATELIPTGYVYGNSVATISRGLNIPITSPLGVTGMRVNMNAFSATPPTTPCTLNNWGEVEDYLVEIIRDSNDVRMDSILGLADGCDLGNVNISFKATNIGYKTMNPVVVSYSVNGGLATTQNFASLAPGATTSYTFATQANLAGNGTKVIRVWHQNPLDTNKRNDTQVFTIISHPTPPNLVPIHDTVCVGSTFTTFTAVSNPPFMTRWYTDMAALNEVATGNSLMVSNPTATSVRYAKSVYTIDGKLGPSSIVPSVADFNPVGQGLIFNVLRNQVRINSVKVRFGQAGVAAIEIRNPANVVIQTIAFLVPSANTDVTVPLNISLSIGTGYRMLMNATSGQAFSIIGFSGFPQLIPGVISITGNTNVFNPTRYNYFFDWDVTYDACSSPVDSVRSVYLTGVNAPLKTLYKDTFFCEYPAVYLDANNVGSTYRWSTGSTNRLIQVTSSGTYKVTITNPQGCKSTDSSKLSILPSPIFNLGNDTTLCSGKTLMLKSGFSNEGFNHSWGMRYAPGPLPAASNTFISGVNKGISFDVLRDGLVFRNFKTRLNITGPSPALLDFAIKDAGNVTLFAKQVQIPASSSGLDVVIDIEKIIPKGNNHRLIITALSANATIASISGYSGFPIVEPNVVRLNADESLNTNNYNCFFQLQFSHRIDNSLQMEPVYTVNSPAWYYGYVYNSKAGCAYEDDRRVSYSPSPNAFLGKDTFGCNTTPIILKAPVGNYSYLWDDGTGGIGVNTRTVNLSGVNKIWVEVTDISNPFGCKSSDTAMVTLASLTKPNLGPDVVTCNNPYSLGISANPLLEYRWSNGGTTNNIKVTESNDYILTVTQVNTTCSYLDTVKVTIQSNPPLDLGSDIVTCKNDPITITANSGWTTYSWSNGFNVNKITVVPVAGLNAYTLTVTGPCGNQTVTKNITYTPDVPNVTLPEDMTVCEPTTLSITNPGTGYNVLWSTTETTLSITVNKTGTYWVTVSNDCGSKTDATRIVFDTFPTPDFIASWTGNFASFSNKSSNAVSYYWEFGDDSTSTDKHPTHYYKARKEYTVKLTVKNSCDSTRTFTKLIDLTKKSSAIQTNLLEDITVYPNPATDILNVRYQKANSQNYIIELISVDGRLVKYMDGRFDSDSELKIDVSSLSEGHYILRITDIKGNQLLKKLSIIK